MSANGRATKGQEVVSLGQHGQWEATAPPPRGGDKAKTAMWQGDRATWLLHLCGLCLEHLKLSKYTNIGYVWQWIRKYSFLAIVKTSLNAPLPKGRAAEPGREGLKRNAWRISWPSRHYKGQQSQGDNWCIKVFVIQLQTNSRALAARGTLLRSVWNSWWTWSAMTLRHASTDMTLFARTAGKGPQCKQGTSRSQKVDNSIKVTFELCHKKNTQCVNCIFV